MLLDENGKKKDSICWNCEKACVRGCSWADDFTPVEGWVAERQVTSTGLDSFYVEQCPEFVREDRNNRTLEMDNDGCLMLVERLLEITKEDYYKGESASLKEIERFIRGHGAARLHRIADPEDAIRKLQRGRLEYRKKKAMKSLIVSKG